MENWFRNWSVNNTCFIALNAAVISGVWPVYEKAALKCSWITAQPLVCLLASSCGYQALGIGPKVCRNSCTQYSGWRPSLPHFCTHFGMWMEGSVLPLPYGLAINSFNCSTNFIASPPAKDRSWHSNSGGEKPMHHSWLNCFPGSYIFLMCSPPTSLSCRDGIIPIILLGLVHY